MEEILRERNIRNIIHFTRAENLLGILDKGLLPRMALDEDESIFNDAYRYDNCENAICASIEFPNYKMFYTLRLNEPGTEWVVLILDASILLDFQCAYCETNAGSEEMYSMSLSNRMGTDAFLRMFAANSDGRRREDLGIPDYYPTNPQAEILIFGEIPIDYIKCIIFDSYLTLGKYRPYIPEKIKAIVDRDYYFARKDYKHWQITSV